MKHIITSFILFSLFFNSFAQNKQPDVTIKEKKVGKRVELYAVNLKDQSYKVTLNILTQDYNYNNAAPIVKVVGPHKAVKMTAMVQLPDTPGIYNYDLTVSEVGYEIALKGNNTFNKKLNMALKNKPITIYTKPNCDLCSDTKQFLKRNRIPFTERSVIKDSVGLKKIVTKYDAHTSYLPILKIQDSVYSKIKSDRDLVYALNNHL